MLSIITKILSTYKKIKVTVNDTVNSQKIPAENKSKYMDYIVLFVVACSVIFLCAKHTKQPAAARKTNTVETKITVQPKSKKTDSDLVVSNNFVANVNGNIVKVPLVQSKDSKGNQTSVVQTIDITNITKQLRPTWEFGGGYAYINGKHYLPLSVQRNYGTNKAVEATFFIGNSEKRSIMVQHKWLIK